MTRIAPALWVLLAVFSLRVGGQLLQWLSPVAWLPPFEIWHGAVFAYWQLLAIQLALIAWLFRIAMRHTRGTVVPRADVGRTLLVFGSIYATVVVIRSFVGALDFSENEWFHRPIPTFFHAVLASWVLGVGVFHARGAAAVQDPLSTPQTRQ